MADLLTWPVRHAFDRLLLQDSWERPYVDAAREAFDALLARTDQLEKVAEAAREYVPTRKHTEECPCGVKWRALRDALAGVPAAPATEEKPHADRVAERAREVGFGGRLPGAIYAPQDAASSVSAGAGQVPADTIKKAQRECVEAGRELADSLLAVKPYLDQPFPDDRRWTPWTRFVEPDLERLDTAVAALAAVDAQETKT